MYYYDQMGRRLPHELVEGAAHPPQKSLTVHVLPQCSFQSLVLVVLVFRILCFARHLVQASIDGLQPASRSGGVGLEQRDGPLLRPLVLELIGLARVVPQILLWVQGTEYCSMYDFWSKDLVSRNISGEMNQSHWRDVRKPP